MLVIKLNLCLNILGGPYNLEYIDSYGDESIDWVVNLFYNKTHKGINYVTLFRYKIAAENMIPIALRDPSVTIPWPGNRTSRPTGQPPSGLELLS